MAIGKLLHWLYCMDFSDMVVLLTACSILFCLADKRFAGYRSWKVLVTIILITATAGVIYTTLGTRAGGEAFQVNLKPLHSYREVMNGGNPEILRSNFMNGVLFYPIGLLATALLSGKWPERIRLVLAVVFCAMLSVGIEYLQYDFSLGQCEIDDVIHNVLGALAGSTMMLKLPPVAESLSEKVKLVRTYGKFTG